MLLVVVGCAQKSPIAGVSKAIYDEGIAVTEALGDEYIKGYLTNESDRNKISERARN